MIQGFQEIARRIRRRSASSHAQSVQARLDRAEILLGQLGWEQVDFPPAVQKQIDTINAVERQQTRFSNQRAAIQGSIEELLAQREEHRREFGDVVVAMEEQLQALLESRLKMGESLAALQQGAGRFEQAILQLDGRYEAAEPELEELRNTRPQTRAIQKRMVRLEDLRFGYDAEREDLVRARAKVLNEVKDLSVHLEESNAQIGEMKQAIAAAKGESSVKEEEFEVMVTSLEDDKVQTSQTVESLDHQKEPAYLAIGRCLADYKIPPRNQPGSLKTVLELREELRKYQQSVEDSLEASAKVGAAAMAVFYIMLVLIVAGIAAAFFMLATHRHA